MAFKGFPDINWKTNDLIAARFLLFLAGVSVKKVSYSSAIFQRFWSENKR